MDRRTILKRMVQGAGLVGAAVVAVPSLVSALSPALGGRRAPLWRRLGPAGQFAVGEVREATIGHRADDGGGAGPAPLPRQAVYVWRPEQGRFVVFSRACTDLGCPVNYDPYPGSEFYYCPCHGGIFNKAGEPVAGPPARPLYQYAWRVRAGVLEIDVTSVPVPA